MFYDNKNSGMVSFKELALDIEKLAAAIGGEEDADAIDADAVDADAVATASEEDKEAGVSLKTLVKAKDAMIANPKRSAEVLKKYQAVNARIIDKESGADLAKNIAKIRKKGLPLDHVNNAHNASKGVIKTTGVSVNTLLSTRTALKTGGQSGTPQMAIINKRIHSKRLGDSAGKLLGRSSKEMDLSYADKAVNKIVKGRQLKGAYISKTANLVSGVINATTAAGRAAVKSPYQKIVPSTPIARIRSTGKGGTLKQTMPYKSSSPSALGYGANKSVDATDKGLLGLRAFARKASADTAGQKPSFGKSLRGFLARDVF